MNESSLGGGSSGFISHSLSRALLASLASAVFKGFLNKEKEKKRKAIDSPGGTCDFDECNNIKCSCCSGRV